MDLYGSYSKSIPQKILVTLCEILFIVIAYFLLFEDGFKLSGLDLEAGDLWRRELVFIFNCITFLRFGYAFIYLIKRKVPIITLPGIIGSFALYYIGYSYLVYETSAPFGITDALGILLFIGGSVINTVSEIQRKKWKENPENKGKLFTKELFGYSRHINYFGDLLWVCGYALITHNAYSVFIPLFLLLYFTLFAIPLQEKYLQKKYGENFKEYKSKTKRLIPFIY